MSFLSRIFNIAKAELHSREIKYPEMELEKQIQEQEALVEDAKIKASDVFQLERSMQREYDKAISDAARWRENAKKYLLEEDEAMAREALEKCEDYKRRATLKKDNLDKHADDIQKLRKNIASMEKRIAELRRSKNILSAQSRAADVKKDIYEAKMRADRGSSSDLISRMKTKAEKKGNEAQISEDTYNLMRDSDDDLRKQIDELSKKQKNKNKSEDSKEKSD